MTDPILSPRAAADLEEIGDFIARDNPRRAVSFIVELEAHCRRVAAAPAAYPLRSDLSDGLRMAVHGRYLILFRILGSQVRIERVVHGARSREDML